MRAWFGYLFILLVSTLWGASPALAASAKTKPLAKLTMVQTPAVDQRSSGTHCDQLEDTEVITAAYTQNNVFGAGVLTIHHGLKSVIYSAAAAYSGSGRDNALIQPFYKLILFPFHAFW